MSHAARSLRRSRPLLGTLVDIRVDGLVPGAADAAVSAAFAEVAEIDRLMSFHSDASDLARLHRAPLGCRVRVDARTHAVLAAARALAQASAGLFDPTIAPVLVARAALPAPRAGVAADPSARWHDLDILDDGCVRRRSALWIDLGGIAKGYAVDRALAVLERRGASAACVNAGGDLARFGAGTETVELRLAEAADAAVPAIALGVGAVATSANRIGHAHARGTHIDGRTRRSAPRRRAASVLASSCMIADALTKVVLASPRAAGALLAAHGASACVYEPARGWCMLGGE